MLKVVQPDAQDILATSEAQPKFDSSFTIPRKSKKSKHLKKPKLEKDKHGKKKPSKKGAKLPDISSESEHECDSDSDSSWANDNSNQVFPFPLCSIYLQHNYYS